MVLQAVEGTLETHEMVKKTTQNIVFYEKYFDIMETTDKNKYQKLWTIKEKKKLNDTRGFLITFLMNHLRSKVNC